jgi:signal transduction histidine kinase
MAASPPPSDLAIPVIVRAALTARRRAGSNLPGGTTVLDRIMPIAGLALWEARTGPLELTGLQTGDRKRSPFQLAAAQTRPGAPWTESVYPADRDKVLSFITPVRPGRHDRSIDYRLIVGEGELLWVRHWLLDRSPGADGRAAVRGILMAIPEQKHLEWECLRVSERECNRIGQDLHDDLCQVLAGMTFMMRALSQRAVRLGGNLAADIDELNDQLIGATNRVRSMAHGLFPAQLNYATLRHALHEFARQTKTRFGVEVTIDLSRKLGRHSADQIIHLYRIAQEAVSNSVRHGQATAIRIVVSAVGRGGEMVIEDNGKGFPGAAARPEGIGMHVMQYRAKILGGQLRFRNFAPHGAVIEIAYPLGSASSRRAGKPSRPS